MLRSRPKAGIHITVYHVGISHSINSHFTATVSSLYSIELKEGSHWRSERPSERLVFLTAVWTAVRTAVRTASVTPPLATNNRLPVTQLGELPGVGGRGSVIANLVYMCKSCW